jgi:small subunit ribosomal protein S20
LSFLLNLELQKVANTPQAKKRAKQNLMHRQHNISLKSKMRTEIKKVSKAIESGNQEQAAAAFKAAQPILDGMVAKGLIHKNKAARHKSRLNAHIKNLESK